jgi:hypothetical protein
MVRLGWVLPPPFHFGVTRKVEGRPEIRAFICVISRLAFLEKPVWRNGRRTGLKIFKIALSDRFSRLLLTRVSAFIYKAILNFSLISPHP